MPSPQNPSISTKPPSATSSAVPTPSSSHKLKHLLDAAHSKAHMAVLLDEAHRYQEAVNVYREAVAMLAHLVDVATSSGHRKKLRHIHDTYERRITILLDALSSPTGVDQHGDNGKLSRSENLMTPMSPASNISSSQNTSTPSEPLSTESVAGVPNVESGRLEARQSPSMAISPLPKPQVECISPGSQSPTELAPPPSYPQPSLKHSSMSSIDSLMSSSTIASTSSALTFRLRSGSEEVSVKSRHRKKEPPTLSSAPAREQPAPSLFQMEKEDGQESGRPIATPSTPWMFAPMTPSHGEYYPMSPQYPVEKPPRDIYQRSFWLMRNLERSMRIGSYVSGRLYIPRGIWLQSNIRLPNLETKIQLCETIGEALSRLAQWENLSDMAGMLHELESVHTALETAQSILTRKLGVRLDSLAAKADESNNAIVEVGSARGRKSSIIAWGSRLSLSMDRMLSRSIQDYVEGVMKVFALAQRLETWPRCDALVSSRLEQWVQVVGCGLCSIVVEDLSLLVAKWIKRSE
ncbi:uncharacterized protein VTP21DRAFT_1808 [Calcarisporiella thermophila]|uniref:uncharacterized protein n=1 Tax=Calcarisporiella thermophila TaxID=911321 RepID=UPI0037435373